MKRMAFPTLSSRSRIAFLLPNFFHLENQKIEKNDFRIREFRKKDLNRILEMRAEYLATELGLSAFRDESFRKQFRLYDLLSLVGQYIAKIYHKIYVGEVRNLIVGFVVIDGALTGNDRIWNVPRVFVDPKHRKRGYARSLLLRACNDAMSHGAKRIYCSVLNENIPAKNLFKSLGFKVFETNNFFRKDVHRVVQQRLPVGFKLVRIGMLDRKALTILDAAREELSERVFAESHLPPLQVRVFSKILSPGISEKLAIVQDHRFVGFQRFDFPSGGESATVFLDILKEYRGQGVEQALLTYAMNRACKLGVLILRIAVNERNVELKRACEKLGFEKLYIMQGMYKDLSALRFSPKEWIDN